MTGPSRRPRAHRGLVGEGADHDRVGVARQDSACPGSARRGRSACPPGHEDGVPPGGHPDLEETRSASTPSGRSSPAFPRQRRGSLFPPAPLPRRPRRDDGEDLAGGQVRIRSRSFFTRFSLGRKGRHRTSSARSISSSRTVSAEEPEDVSRSGVHHEPGLEALRRDRFRLPSISIPIMSPCRMSRTSDLRPAIACRPARSRSPCGSLPRRTRGLNDLSTRGRRARTGSPEGASVGPGTKAAAAPRRHDGSRGSPFASPSPG